LVGAVTNRYRCSGIGIGSHLAKTFHERGYRVFATARKAESLPELAVKGIETLSLVVDDSKSVKACYEEVRERLNGKGLDYLVNNAGRSMSPRQEL
jgi:1-acylglycerone phosphate reductase